MKKNSQGVASAPKRGIIRGFYLPKQLYKLCMTELRCEKYFRQNLNSMSSYKDTLKHYETLVEDKISLEVRTQVISNAFDKIPMQYHAAVRYMINTADTEEKQSETLQEKYGVEIKEAKAWLKKLVYFYADEAGYPVPHSGREYEFYIDENGDCKIRLYE